jgi:fumarylacetoacetase
VARIGQELQAVSAYGVFSIGPSAPRVGALVDGGIVDLAAALGDEIFAAPSLNPFLSKGSEFWSATHARVADCAPGVALDDARLHLPIEVADFVDFYSSLEHATNAARILRPQRPTLAPNWRSLPVGYHARAGTVIVSGDPVPRPSGQFLRGGRPVYAPTAQLDVEVELGFVIGAGSPRGTTVAVDQFEQHVFGAVILLDWSARDLQSFEAQPLGPFLAKSFATTISPWVVPLADLAAARVEGPTRDPEPLPYLRERDSWSLDVQLELRVNGRLVSRPNYASMYWTPAQQLAHLSANGASLRTGDLYGTGTISSFDDAAMGSLLELTRGGTRALRLADGTMLGYLQDGDSVSVTASAAGVDFGEAAAVIG